MGDAHLPNLDPAPPVANPNQLVAELRTILPAGSILTSDEQQRPFECDALPIHTAMPLVTVLPDSVAQVQAVMKLCHRLAVPVVCRGAGTGLSAGAMPWPGGVLLVLTKLDQILAIEPDSFYAVVQPGVRNLAVSEAVADLGLYYAPDPSSQLACSIGGNVAENAGGVHCLKYGLTVHNVLALKVVTVTGELLEVNLEREGPDLLALLIGSEGLLAVVVEIKVKLRVRPPAVQTLLAAFDKVGDASEAVSRLIGSGITPAGLEMMDQLALTAAEDFAGAGYPRDAAAILLVELDGGHSEVEEELPLARRVLQEAGASVRQARDERERAQFWRGRKSAFPAVGRLFPDSYCMDGTIPRGAIGNVLDYINQRSAHYQMPVANVFHAGDGNLHPLILFDANVPGAVEAAQQFGADILEKCLALGGTITGEHGVGAEKLNQMASLFNDAELAQLRRLKQAFDPDGLLNPGKVIPTLKRCQEYRALRHG